jgi:DNA polymerase III subunit delta'
MKKEVENLETLPPSNQLSLYGYKDYFNFFIKMFKKNKLPNAILFSGPKGLGKATFAYHFFNYILSEDEKNNYSLPDSKINYNNKSYNLLLNNTHPNFFLLDNNLLDSDIKIDQVRNALKFHFKSTYSKNIKIIMIDNAQFLNKHSSNALLKVIEEPNDNTFFFIIHDTSTKLQKTIKSRCLEFKFFLNTFEKKNILQNLINDYKENFDIKLFDKNFYSDTPGNLLKILFILKDSNIDITKDNLKCVLYLIEEYKSKSSSELLFFISLFVERFYNHLSISNNKFISRHFINKSKILNQIDNMKKFNLDKKNFLVSIRDILYNEK